VPHVRVTIIGAGAIGGITGAYMARNGADVTLVEQADDHLDAIRRDGLQIDGIDRFTVQPAVLRPNDVRGPLELVIVAVKTQHTASALDLIEPHLTAESIVMPLQNGISALWIAERIGQDRTIPTSITTNNFYTSPGHLTYNRKGVVHVGESDGRLTPRVEEIVKLLAYAYHAEASDNVWGYIWSKMVAGSMTFTTALVDAPMGAILTKSDRHKRMFARIGSETAAVARARQVRLEPGDDLDPNGLLPGSSEATMFREVERFAEHAMNVYSGVWRDIAVRKRRTEGDTLIGPVVEEGERLGVAMPLNKAMKQLLSDVEDGQRPQSWENLDELIAIAERELPRGPTRG
jgi:2-dehydropantoate 2-reductase